MHELRKDPLLGTWIAVLKDSKGPEFYTGLNTWPADHEPDSGDCLFCAEEGRQGPEIFSIRDGNPSGWLTKVVPRTDPLFQIEGELGRRGVGMYDKMNSIGANEIIIESPHHRIPAEDLGFSHMRHVVATYRHRLTELERDPRFRYTLIYKDSGKAAGEYYRHPHSQLVATPVIPKGIKDELDGAKAYYFYKERCIFCDMVNEELRTGERVIMDSGYFVAFTPFAPRMPFEYWILPKRHYCAFQDTTGEEMDDFSLILTATLKKMKVLLNNPPYHYVLHTAPNRIPRKDHWHTLGDDFHWHVEVTPQLTVKSGFEWGSGFCVVPTSPEKAADFLKGTSSL
ncbi:MAG TPA: galactose-1-phosphate uridylyltransferase [Dissulfurispiraceae bacterium]